MVERVAAALDRYSVGLWHEQRGVLWRVYDRDNGGRMVSECRTQQEARDVCRRANARAVIEAMKAGPMTEATTLAAASALNRHMVSQADIPTIMQEVFEAILDAALTEPEAPSPR